MVRSVESTCNYASRLSHGPGNGSCHSCRVENIPILSWREDKKSRNGIALRRGTSEEYVHKKHLMETVDGVRLKYCKYKTDELAKEMGHTVLYLLLYDWELNPLEFLG
jgi:hypothetical protein